MVARPAGDKQGGMQSIRMMNCRPKVLLCGHLVVKLPNFVQITSEEKVVLSHTLYLGSMDSNVIPLISHQHYCEVRNCDYHRVISANVNIFIQKAMS